jgi:O-antigen ligase
MTLRGWTNYFVFILLLLAIIHFVTKSRTPPTHKNQAQEHRLATWAIIFTLASPILAIFFSQLFRGEFTSSAFDGPSRFLLAVPVFLYLKDRSFNFTKIIEWTIPISLIICLGAYLLNPAASEEWGGRAATYFVDTITFGVYCLILGFICLASIKINDEKESALLTILKIIGLAIGFYLAIQSQSRSAWTAALACACACLSRCSSADCARLPALYRSICSSQYGIVSLAYSYIVLSQSDGGPVAISHGDFFAIALIVGGVMILKVTD